MTDYLAIKSAFRRIVKSCGGVRQCAELPGGRRFAAYSEWGSPDNMERFPPIDIVADLEAEAGGRPMVAEALAELAGYTLVKLPAPSDRTTLHQSLGAMAKETGEAIAKVGHSLEDGRVTQDEAEEACREIREALRVLVAVEQKLKVIVATEHEGGGDD